MTPGPHRLAVPLIALLALAAGCDQAPLGPDCAPGSDPTCESHQEVVDGVNLTALFAAPSPAEVASVSDAWTDEDGGRRIEEGPQFDLGGRETITVLRGGDGETDGLFLGAIRQPPREAGDQRRRPVLLFLGDDADVDPARTVQTLPIREDLRDEFVLVIGVRRGGTLRVGREAFASASPGGEPLGLDGPLDALALLDYARDHAGRFGIDPGHVGIIGHGTGGHAALLAGARTADDAYLLSLAAPTSFFIPTVREAARWYLRGEPFDAFPGLVEVLDATVGRVRDGEMTIGAARAALIARSPAVFVEPPQPSAFLFAVHGGRDLVVPDQHARALDPRIDAGGGVYLFLPEADHDSVLSDPQVWVTGAGFLCDLLLPGNPVCS